MVESREVIGDPWRLTCACRVSQAVRRDFERSAEITLLEAEALGWRHVGGSWQCPRCNGIAAHVVAALERSPGRLRAQVGTEVTERYGEDPGLELVHAFAAIAGDADVVVRHFRLEGRREPAAHFARWVLRAAPPWIATAFVEFLLEQRQRSHRKHSRRASRANRESLVLRPASEARVAQLLTHVERLLRRDDWEPAPDPRASIAAVVEHRVAQVEPLLSSLHRISIADVATCLDG